MKSADVIVVGAGAAGCVLAARLSEDPARRVILLEAGGRGRNPLLRVPLRTGLFLRSPYANWSYTTQPEAGLAGRSTNIPRGRVLGGSTAINGMVWARGRPADFDGWAQAGLRGWSWDDALAGYRRIERFQGGASEIHGGNGELPITDAAVEHELIDAFIAAGRQAGHPASADFNAPPCEGVGRYHFSIAGGRRWSAAHAFLHPAAERKNLRVIPRAYAHRILLDGTTATGLVARVNGRDEVFHAPEIVLCGGTINSPQLLMLSGIGPADHLRDHGIDVAVDLPGVGRNLHDHVLVRVEHACTKPITLQSLTRLDRAAFALLRALVAGTGPAASFPLAAGVMARSDPGLDEADLQSHFLPGLTTATLRVPFLAGPLRAGDGHGFMANISQMRPESRGTLRLASADPSAKPLIHMNYLSDPRDRAALRSGVRILRDIFRQPAFNPYRGAELSPGPAEQSDADLDAWIARTADTVHHPVGTCRMGLATDVGAVVDDRLRVHGFTGLRVADASVMPRITSGNTAAPSMLIGQRCADFLRSGE
ncbi:MAG: GMC family oxidoreductase N-terminal domain-containing protein [Alphaproteobacteria bacterium]|nr:GMC family oxidoreductase N-terminal domain-containing protein [Alphaproteobacteria bacterium]